MKTFNNIAFICGFILFALSALVGCEDARFYTVDYPDWLTERIDSLSASSTTEVEDFDGMEDVYTFGETDYSSTFWSAFSKYYQVPDGEKWQAKFILYINPDETIYYKNFALVISNDVDRDDTANYKEYGAIRFDATNDSTSFNSQWGSQYWDLPFKYTSATLLFSPDDDDYVDNLSSLGGTVTISVDRTDADAFTVTMTNGTQTKTYAQPYALDNLNSDMSNDNIRCFLCPEGSYITFQKTTHEPIGGVTSSEDKDPVSMVLQDVPSQIQITDDLETAMAGVTAVVTFEEDVTKTVTADELTFSLDMTTPGEKTLVAVYNKTYNGENCDTPIVATATIEVISNVTGIAVTSAVPTYYFYTTAATSGMSDRTLAFDSSNVVVTATYDDNSTGVIGNSLLTFTPDVIYAQSGTYNFSVSYGDLSATSYVTVEGITTAGSVTNSYQVGASDFSTLYLGAFSDTFSVSGGETKSISFTNYSNAAYNWNNFIVVMCEDGDTSTQAAVCRADNYMVTGSCLQQSTGNDWDVWKAAMAQASVTVYVTNCNNGTADVQCVMVGNDSITYYQYYLGVDISALSNPAFALSVEAAYLLF